MPTVEKDEEREHRISMEIIVDAYGPEEQSLGWYYYLEENLQFPFKARCIKERRVSPLRVGEEVEVLGMTSEDDCGHEMFVEINWMGRRMGVPLSQVEGVEVDSQTRQAIEDWHYWVARGYQF
ncbi:MAG: calcium-binding protein [Anaerolineae bacterium]